MLFLLFFYIDLESLHDSDEQGNRIKGTLFIVCKTVCLVIQMWFFKYEIFQLSKEKKEYFTDFWNYFELLGIILYTTGALLDIFSDQVSDACRIMFVCSLMFALIKVLFLIRIFKSFSFLVMMTIQVILDVQAFLLLFMFFVVIFAACYRVVDVDVSNFGRLPDWISSIIVTLKSAMGDFGLIGNSDGFDVWEDKAS
jgi:hypothetical protein